VERGPFPVKLEKNRCGIDERKGLHFVVQERQTSDVWPERGGGEDGVKRKKKKIGFDSRTLD